MPPGKTMLPGILRVALLASLIAGCEAGYVLEQGWRQLRMSSRQVPIDSLELAGKLSMDSMEKLRWVPRVLDFCRKELDLDPGDSYQTYLDTGGRPISYVVTAAHPLALVAYEWHFPFVGNVPYKGYFDEEDARAEALYLSGERYDVDVLPVGAYSTLGWFSDPILSGMLEGSVANLLDLIIHEATHRTVYFPGRASFNESLATHVAREGTVRFLMSHEELRPQLPAYLAGRKKSLEREQLLLRLRNDLDALYRSKETEGAKMERKREIFRSAADAYRRLDPRNGLEDFPPSNAFVLSVAWYHEFQRLLVRLQEHLGGNPSNLMAYLKGLPRSEDPLPAIQEELSPGTP